MITELIRDDLRENFAPYESARLTNNQDIIRLHANESPWGDIELNRYPQQIALDEMLDFYQVKAEQFLLTRGSNDGIDLLIRLFCVANCHEIVTMAPSYGMYRVSAQLQGVQVNTVELVNFTFDVDAILSGLTSKTKIIFICSPNNPTGNVIDIQSLRKLCEQKCIIVVDEAYVEFADNASFSCLLNEYSNLVILRTLSKAFGLAALRVGIVLANPVIIKWLRTIMPPYPIPTPCYKLLIDAFKNERIMQMWVNVMMLKRSRDWLQNNLEKLSFVEKVYPSQANFLLVKLDNAEEVLQFVADKGIQLRIFKGYADFLRISIGTLEDNQRLLQILTQWEPCDEK